MIETRRCYVTLGASWVKWGLAKNRDEGMRICFDYRPYEKRSPEAQEDYDRLVVSIFHHGVKKPIIVWTHPETKDRHILIGQRRAEIAMGMGIRHIDAIEILEDVRKWWKPDLERLQELRDIIGEYEY